jgi:mono/diheme cytochrome c family protein
MRLLKLAVTVASGLALAACGLMIPAGCHVQSALTPQQEEGKRLYDAGCAHCHEENDLHLKKVPPDLHGLFKRKTLPDGAPATDAEVERILLAGKGTMPSFTYQMTHEQMNALLAYLHTGMRDERSP